MSYPPSHQRIGDAERDNAVDALRDHLAAGRLTPEDLDERLSIVLTAKTQHELDAAFVDLPFDPNAVGGISVWQASHPNRRPAEARPLRVAQRWLLVLAPILWLTVFLGWPMWWLIYVVWGAAFVVSTAPRRCSRDARRAGRYCRDDGRRTPSRLRGDM